MNTALLATAAPAQGGILSLLPTIAMFGAVVYFMIIRPNKKRQKQAQDLMSSIKVGDTVQTIGGFVGDIQEVNDEDFIILSGSSTLRIKKSAVGIKLNAAETPVTDIKASEDDDEDFKIEDFEI